MTKVALLYGGTSEEHEVSKMSAKNVRHALEQAGLEVVPIFITKAGEWQLEHSDLRGHALMMRLPELCDVAFPITHGTYGEDGSLQGFLAMMKVPYVGCDVIGSATCFDKEISKHVFHDNNLPVADYLVARSSTHMSYQQVIDALGEDVFVKPACQGSSVGVSHATTAAEFTAALQTALKFDHKALIERAVKGREIEFAVLEENGRVTVSPPGEIVVEDGFYDYENKYITDKAILKAPTAVTDEQLRQGTELARRAFVAAACRGMARVDMFLENDTWLVNEINTIPGFTNISMYPKLFEVSGIPQPELVRRLVAAAKI